MRPRAWAIEPAMLPLSRDDAAVVRLDKPRRRAARRSMPGLTILVIDAYLRHGLPTPGWQPDLLVCDPLVFGAQIPWAGDRRIELLPSALTIPTPPGRQPDVVVRRGGRDTTLGGLCDGTLVLARLAGALKIDVRFRDSGLGEQTLYDWQARRLYLAAAALDVQAATDAPGRPTIIERATFRRLILSDWPLGASEPVRDHAAMTETPPTLGLL